MRGVREKKQREKEKAGNRWVLCILLMRATPAGVLLSCHELGTKLIINNESSNRGLGFAGTA